MLLALVSGGTAERPEGGWPPDTTTAALVTRGLWAAAAGDTPRARRFLEVVQSRPAAERTRAGADPALLEAWIAAQGGRWDDVIRILEPAARQGSEIGFSEDRAGRVTHLRLVTLHVRIGRLEDARRHWRIVEATFTRPDPELRPLIEEARVALASGSS